VVAFQVLDIGEGQSARGDYRGPIPGAVRPLLNWETEVRLRAEEAFVQTEEITVS